MMNKKVIAVALALALAGGSYAQDDTAKKKVKAYMVSDAHLDTQWNWDLTHTIRDLAADAGEEKLLLRSTIIAAVNKMFLDCAFAVMHQEQALWPDILADLA
mgnify:CR=1 FL=1